jgi:superfamily I DNA/RNA helicase
MMLPIVDIRVKIRRLLRRKLTCESNKGLEFKTVILAGLGTLKDDEKNHAEEVRLLYVGMTRAREKLLVTSSKANFYTERLLG